MIIRSTFTSSGWGSLAWINAGITLVVFVVTLLLRNVQPPAAPAESQKPAPAASK